MNKKKEALSLPDERTVSKPYMEENQQKNNTSSVEMKELDLERFSLRNISLAPPSVFSFPQYPVDIPTGGGSMHVLLGPPSAGKTSLALHLGMSAAAAGRHVFYASWDWNSSFIAARSAAWLTSMELSQLDTFYFSDAVGIGDLGAICEQLPRQSLVVLDYVQVCPVRCVPTQYSVGVEGRVSYVCDRIQEMARRRGQIFFLIAAENRVSLTVGGHELHSGYGTSRLEYSADSVIAVRWDAENMQNMLRLKVLKNRWAAAEKNKNQQTYRFSPIEIGMSNSTVSAAGVGKAAF